MGKDDKLLKITTTQLQIRFAGTWGPSSDPEVGKIGFCQYLPSEE